jgi:hypothetical protein
MTQSARLEPILFRRGQVRALVIKDRLEVTSNLKLTPSQLTWPWIKVLQASGVIRNNVIIPKDIKWLLNPPMIERLKIAFALDKKNDLRPNEPITADSLLGIIVARLSEYGDSRIFKPFAGALSSGTGAHVKRKLEMAAYLNNVRTAFGALDRGDYQAFNAALKILEKPDSNTLLDFQGLNLRGIDLSRIDTSRILL